MGHSEPLPRPSTWSVCSTNALRTGFAGDYFEVRALQSRIVRRIFLCLVLSPLTGCYYWSRLQDPTVMGSGERHDPWQHHFLWGLAGDPEVDVREYCPLGAYEVAVGQNFGTTLATWLTLGLYSPRKVYIHCAHPTPPPMPASIGVPVASQAGGAQLMIIEQTTLGGAQ